MNNRKEINVRETKSEFIKSIHKWLMRTLDTNNNSEFKKCFQIEGSSIMCKLPPCFFNDFSIPENTIIEMKFISKKK